MSGQRYNTDAERLEARRRTWNENGKRQYQLFKELRAELKIPVTSKRWSVELPRLRALVAAKNRVIPTGPCRDCGMDAERDERGNCLFCHPRRTDGTAREQRCDENSRGTAA